MAILVILVSSDSSKGSVRTPAGRVILFGTIPTPMPDTTPVITPPTTQTDTVVIPTEIPIIGHTIPPSRDYTPASLDYSPASDTESDPSSDHIPPLPAISPFLSSPDDTTDSDTPDTAPSPTHGTPFTKITFSTQRSLVIPHDSARVLLQDFHSDASTNSSSRHSLSDHSSPDLLSTSAGPSRKRHRSPVRYVPALPPVFGALSFADPRETSLRDDVMVRGSDKPHLEQDIDPEIQAEIDECTAYANALRDRGIGARVVVEADDREESETGTGAWLRAVECTYETLGSLVQRFHDHTEAIPVHHIQAIKGVQREQGHRIVGVESAVPVLTERITELERNNRRLRDTASDES
nr:hypothetical protein [Tanacetum cinerariifolium]